MDLWNHRSLFGIGLFDGELAFEYFFERDERFGPRGVEALELVLDYFEEMVVVACHHFCEDVVMSRGEVTFHHFRYLFEILDYFVEFRGVVEEYADICAGFVAEGGGIYQTFRSIDHSFCREALEALVDCGTRYAEFACYFEIRLSSVFAKFLKNLDIYFVELLSIHG